MDSSRKSNKIRDIVRLQQILKKWKKLAHNNSTTTSTSTGSASGSKSIKFLKKTLSFSEASLNSINTNGALPKGYMAVCVGEESKRFVIPTEYLSHQSFGILLREAEEEFGFQQEGVLKLPCDVDLFEKILKMIENKRLSTDELLLLNDDVPKVSYANLYSPDQDVHHPQMCR